MNDMRKQVVQAYFEKAGRGEFDNAFFELFTTDVEVYYPKFGFATGREGIIQFGGVIGRQLQSISFELDQFNYIESGNHIVVEGREKGVMYNGVSWPDNEIGYGKFCSVFEFRGDQISRMHVYVDPDFASLDKDRIALFKGNVELHTREVVELYYDLQFGRKEGNIVDLFAEEVDWDLPGNEGKFPWVGKRRTKGEIMEFFKVLGENIQPERFELDFIAVNGENAVAVGELTSKIVKYGRSFSTGFTVNFKVKNGKIVKYHFLEDSYKLNEMMQ